MKTKIDRNYSGKLDGFLGTGATTIEQALVYIFGLSGAALLGYHLYTADI